MLRGTQECMERVADKDLEMRNQKVEHAEERMQLEKQRDQARAGVNIVYSTERASHKAMKRTADELGAAEEALRLSGGAAAQLMRGAMCAVEKAPAEARPGLLRKIAPAYNAMSAGRVGLSQAREAVSGDAVAASQQARQGHQQAFEAVYYN